MILFGHLGLTYAIAAGMENAGLGKKLFNSDKAIDFRLVFIGAILPDLVDKLIIFFISNETVHSGRIYGHTLLFAIVLTGIGKIVWNKYKKPWLLLLAGCSIIHLAFDSMWLYMVTLFWPVYDLFSSHITVYPQAFNHAIMSILNQEFKDVSLNSLAAALLNPYNGIAEISGFLIMVHLFMQLISQKRMGLFIRTGRLRN